MSVGEPTSLAAESAAAFRYRRTAPISIIAGHHVRNRHARRTTPASP
jgi:hypothetical protein